MQHQFEGEPDGRQAGDIRPSLAMTNLELTVMWAIKGLTA